MMSVVNRTYWMCGPTRLKKCLIPWDGVGVGCIIASPPYV